MMKYIRHAKLVGLRKKESTVITLSAIVGFLVTMDHLVISHLQSSASDTPEGLFPLVMKTYLVRSSGLDNDASVGKVLRS